MTDNNIMTNIFTLYDVKNYINSESFNAIELENILKENEWFAGSSDSNFGTDGYDHLIMQEDGNVDLVRITPNNIDRSDIQAYIQREVNQGNSVCMNDEGQGSSGLAMIDSASSRFIISDLNNFSEPVEVPMSEVSDSFREFINEWMSESEDNHIYKLTKGDYSIYIVLYIY